MTIIPPSPFTDSGMLLSSPDEAVALADSQAPVATADIQSSCGIRESRPEGSVYPSHVPPDRPSLTNGSAAANRLEEHSHRVKLEAGVAPGPQEAIDCIGEIFIGAAKIEPIEIWFENTAYPREDELLYEVLSAMDDPRAPSLREMPYGFEAEFDPPPLFLRKAG